MAPTNARLIRGVIAPPLETIRLRLSLREQYRSLINYAPNAVRLASPQDGDRTDDVGAVYRPRMFAKPKSTDDERNQPVGTKASLCSGSIRNPNGEQSRRQHYDCAGKDTPKDLTQ